MLALLPEFRPVEVKGGLGPLLIVDRLLDDLKRPGETSSKQLLLAHRLQMVARDICVGPLDRCLGLRDQRLLQELLLFDVLDRRIGSNDIRLSLLQLGAVIVVIDLTSRSPALTFWKSRTRMSRA